MCTRNYISLNIRQQYCWLLFEIMGFHHYLSQSMTFSQSSEALVSLWCLEVPVLVASSTETKSEKTSLIQCILEQEIQALKADTVSQIRNFVVLLFRLAACIIRL